MAASSSWSTCGSRCSRATGSSEWSCSSPTTSTSHVRASRSCARAHPRDPTEPTRKEHHDGVVSPPLADSRPTDRRCAKRSTSTRRWVPMATPRGSPGRSTHAHDPSRRIGSVPVICPSCRHENTAGARFCDRCATPLAARCPSCGAHNEPGARFCNQCAAALGHQTTGPAPKAHTPAHLAEKILGSRSALEGERKQVTVLFADVKGSMELEEQLDPEQWSQIMSRFFTLLADGVERFEGFVDKFTGDGIMALFGAPIAHED